MGRGVRVRRQASGLLPGGWSTPEARDMQAHIQHRCRTRHEARIGHGARIRYRARAGGEYETHPAQGNTPQHEASVRPGSPTAVEQAPNSACAAHCTSGTGTVSGHKARAQHDAPHPPLAPPPPGPRTPAQPTPQPPPPHRRSEAERTPVEPHQRSRTPARTRGASPTMPSPRAREAPPATADADPRRTPPTPTKSLARVKPHHRTLPPTQAQPTKPHARVGPHHQRQGPTRACTGIPVSDRRSPVPSRTRKTRPSPKPPPTRTSPRAPPPAAASGSAASRLPRERPPPRR